MAESGVAAGAELGGYRIEAPLGRGGMGVVYRAHDLALDRKVALKLLAPELAADVGFRERFMRESRLAASLDDPAIIPIYDAGQAGDQLYIAMRLVDGTDLKRLLRAEGKLEPERALRLLKQVAGALDAAHERGLVHRDVKPSNILIDTREHCYLADFGLSRRLTDADGAGDGRSLGTIDYVAPEQIRGEEPSGHADLYSLGCVLYECLEGYPPFAGSDTAVAFAHLEREPPSLPRLHAVLQKALAKEPGDRYPSGHALIEAAEKALGIAQRHRRRWAVAGALAGVTAITAVALSVVLTRGENPPKTVVRPDPDADALIRIDPDTNRITSTMPVGRKASGVAAAGSYVWVTNFADGNVWRIDASTRVVRKILVEAKPTGVAAVRGLALLSTEAERKLVSVAAADGSVSLISRRPGDVSGPIPVAAGTEGLWFGDAARHVAGQVLAFGGAASGMTIPVPAGHTSFLSRSKAFDDLAVGEGSIWALGDAFGRTLWRLDPISEKAIAAIRLPFIPRLVAVGEGGVWVTAALHDAIWRVDPGTNRLAAKIRLPAAASAIATGDGAIWVASSEARAVWRIDPRRRRIVATIPTAATPTQIAVGDADSQGVWVTTTRAARPVPRGAIGIGLLADCAGAFGDAYGLSLAGAEVVLLHHGGHRVGATIADGIAGARIAGRPVRLAFGCSDGTSSSALAEARRLVEQVGVRILIGPSTSSEELALWEYARSQPGIAFINGTAAAQVLDPPRNVFSFTPDGAQQMAGLATYAYRTLGWRRAVTVADSDDDLFNWAQTAGFVAEFCSLGGRIAKRVWVDPEANDYASVVRQIPEHGVDGVVVAAGARTVGELIKRYPGLHGNLDRKLLFGLAAGLTAAGPFGPRAADVVWAGHFFAPPGQATSFQYNGDMNGSFRDAGAPQQLWDLAYHDAMAAVVAALGAAHGDLSHGGRRFMAALARVRLTAPSGSLRLDANRQAIGTNYLGDFSGNQIVRSIPGVERTFGGYFTPSDPPPGEATPACKRP